MIGRTNFQALNCRDLRDATTAPFTLKHKLKSHQHIFPSKPKRSYVKKGSTAESFTINSTSTKSSFYEGCDTISNALSLTRNTDESNLTCCLLARVQTRRNISFKPGLSVQVGPYPNLLDSQNILQQLNGLRR